MRVTCAWFPFGAVITCCCFCADNRSRLSTIYIFIPFTVSHPSVRPYVYSCALASLRCLHASLEWSQRHRFSMISVVRYRSPMSLPQTHHYPRKHLLICICIDSSISRIHSGFTLTRKLMYIFHAALPRLHVRFDSYPKYYTYKPFASGER